MDQPQHQEYREPDMEQEAGLDRCALHPDVETGLACGKCATYICPRCMIQTPVGARCRDCARVSRHPTFDVTRTYYVRAGVAGIVTAFATGLLWALALPIGILFLGIGYVVGEAISRAANRKRGTGLVTLAVISMVVALVVSQFQPTAHPVGLLFWVVYVGGAFYMAVNRVR